MYVIIFHIDLLIQHDEKISFIKYYISNKILIDYARYLFMKYSITIFLRHTHTRPHRHGKWPKKMSCWQR